MSAYICSDAQFAVLVSRVAMMPYSPIKPGEEVAAANLLKRENIRSVNYRYNKRNRITRVEFNEDDPALRDLSFSLRGLIKLAQCIEHQSCERPDYERSRANHLLSRIIAFLLLELPEVKSGLASCEVWSI